MPSHYGAQAPHGVSRSCSALQGRRCKHVRSSLRPVPETTLLAASGRASGQTVGLKENVINGRLIPAVLVGQPAGFPKSRPIVTTWLFKPVAKAEAAALAAPEPVSEDVIGGDVFDTIIADTPESRGSQLGVRINKEAARNFRRLCVVECRGCANPIKRGSPRPLTQDIMRQRQRVRQGTR
jgi:hypothetical protein